LLAPPAGDTDGTGVRRMSVAAVEMP
jgi:hypothetical protein